MESSVEYVGGFETQEQYHLNEEIAFMKQSIGEHDTMYESAMSDEDRMNIDHDRDVYKRILGRLQRIWDTTCG